MADGSSGAVLSENRICDRVNHLVTITEHLRLTVVVDGIWMSHAMQPSRHDNGHNY